MMPIAGMGSGFCGTIMPGGGAVVGGLPIACEEEMLTFAVMALFIVAQACIAGPWSREMSRSLCQSYPVGAGGLPFSPHVRAAPLDRAVIAVGARFQ
jgi:hypothetical protein